MYPTDEQQGILARTFGCVRFVYNWALRKKTDAYYQEQQRLYYKDLSALLPDLKKQDETAWLSEIASVPLQQALRHLDKAFTAFFEGKGNYPTFKKKRNRQSATYVGTAFHWDGKGITLAKMSEPLNIVWSRPLPEGAVPSRVTITKDCAHRYFVSILVEDDIAHLPASDNTIGADLGLKDFVVLSTGERVGNGRFFARDEKKLAKAQRRPRDAQRDHNKHSALCEAASEAILVIAIACWRQSGNTTPSQETQQHEIPPHHRKHNSTKDRLEPL
jgi:putative transposase